MALPANRFRAMRRAANLPVFDQVVSDYKGASTLTLNITTSTAATLIIATASSSSPTLTVDGASVTQLGRVDYTSFYAVPVSPGAHTVTMSSGTGCSMIVASYTNVTSVGTYSYGGNNSASPSLSPTGTGTLAVAAFQGNQISGANASGNTTIREKRNHGTANYNMALADSPTSPVTVTQTSVWWWYASGVWLS